MKKALSIIFVIVFTLSFVSCSNSELPFEEFEAKYKRADYDEFLSDPSDFLKDYIRAKNVKYYDADDLSFLSTWNFEGKEESQWSISEGYNKDAVFFNKSVRLDASTFQYSDNTITFLLFFKFEIGDSDESIKLAEKMCDSAFDIFGDAETIRLNAHEASESELRKAFANKDITSFDLSFKNLEINFYNYTFGNRKIYLY